MATSNLSTPSSSQSPDAMEVDKTFDLRRSTGNQFLTLEMIQAMYDREKEELPKVYHYGKSFGGPPDTKPRILNDDRSGVKSELYMRNVMVGWLFEVRLEYGLGGEVFAMAIDVLDRYLFKCQVFSTNYQLLGITCLFLAAKYLDEMDYFTITEAVYICDDYCTSEDVKKMESLILNMIGYEFHTSDLRYQFYSLMSSELPSDSRPLVSYLFYLSFMDPLLSRFRPSMISASCIAITDMVKNGCGESSDDNCKKRTGYTFVELRDCIHSMCILCKRISVYQDKEQRCIYDEYKNPKRGSASLTVIDTKMIHKAIGYNMPVVISLKRKNDSDMCPLV